MLSYPMHNQAIRVRNDRFPRAVDHQIAALPEHGRRLSARSRLSRVVLPAVARPCASERSVSAIVGSAVVVTTGRPRRPASATATAFRGADFAEPAPGDDLHGLAVRSGFHDLLDQRRAADEVTAHEGLAPAGRGRMVG